MLGFAGLVSPPATQHCPARSYYGQEGLMPAYHEIFLTGENVEIKDTYYLEQFINDGVILSSQLAFSRMHVEAVE